MTLAANLVALSRRVVGILGNNLIALDASGKMPGVDGSQLTGLIKNGGSLTLSGTAVDFTGIPPTAKRITIVLASISTSGSSNIILQLGKSGGIENTGYASSGAITAAISSSGNSTTGLFVAWTGGPAVVSSVIATLINIGGNRWIESASGGLDNGGGVYYSFGSGGDKTLAGVLDRLRLTTLSGTDTFDAGTATVLWE